MRLLLTGFEPFNNSPINPSQQAVQRLASCPPAGIELFTAILPVEHRRGPKAKIIAWYCLAANIGTNNLASWVAHGSTQLPKSDAVAGLIINPLDSI